jgi:hypothetical protein
MISTTCENQNLPNSLRVGNIFRARGYCIPGLGRLYDCGHVAAGLKKTVSQMGFMFS